MANELGPSRPWPWPFFPTLPGKPCLGTFPLITQGANFSPRGWSIGPVLVRLSSKFLGSDGARKFRKACHHLAAEPGGGGGGGGEFRVSGG